MITIPREAVTIAGNRATITGPTAQAIYKKTGRDYSVEVRSNGGSYSAAFGTNNTSAWRYALVASGLIAPGVFADGDDVDED